MIDESQAGKKMEFEQMDLFTDYQALEQEREEEESSQRTGTQDTGSHVGYQEKIWKERDLKRIELSGGGNGKREKPTDRGT